MLNPATSVPTEKGWPKARNTRNRIEIIRALLDKRQCRRQRQATRDVASFMQALRNLHREAVGTGHAQVVSAQDRAKHAVDQVAQGSQRCSRRSAERIPRIDQRAEHDGGGGEERRRHDVPHAKLIALREDAQAKGEHNQEPEVVVDHVQGDTRRHAAGGRFRR